MLKKIFFFILSITISYNAVSDLYADETINSWQKIKGDVEKSTVTEKVYIDNIHIQTYKGQTGLWRKIESGTDISALARPYQADEELLVSINELPKNSRKIYNIRWVFIPFSAHYLTELEKSGITRLTLDVTVSEYIWPIEGIRITSRLGKRWGKFHPGLDIAAATGTLVLAAMDGEVSESRYFGDYGNAVLLNNSDSYVSIYAHLSETLVKKGDKVKKGQVIGYSGSSGHSTGPHLHFEVRFLSLVLNPEVFLPEFKESIYAFIPKELNEFITENLTEQ